MLFCTSLVAFVGAGEQPALTPRKLSLFNTSINKAIQDVNFVSSVLAVKMNRQRLVVVLEKRTHVHNLETLELLRTLDTAANPRGVCALTCGNDSNLLALPASSGGGGLRVYDLQVDGGNVLCEVEAHKAAVAVMAWNWDGSLLASASQTGTVIRVHRMPQASKSYTFRRGTYPATIYSIAFSPAGVEPQLLCACSSHGSVHIFRLEQAQKSGAAMAVSAASGLFAAMMPHSMVDMVEPPRNIAAVRLPCQNVPAICAIHAHSSAHKTDAATAAAGGAVPEKSSNGPATECVSVVVATAEGLLYQYSIEDLRGPHGPKCSLEGEWALLGLGA